MYNSAQQGQQRMAPIPGSGALQPDVATSQSQGQTGMVFHAPFRDPMPNPAEVPLQWNATHQSLPHGGLPFQGQPHQGTPGMGEPYHLQNANGVLSHLLSFCTAENRP